LQTALFFLAFFTLAVWVYLLTARGGFWRVSSFDADRDSNPGLAAWPAVVAIVPARNEALAIAQTIASLLAQEYPGTFSIVVVDDHSEDGTAEIARKAAAERDSAPSVTVHSAAPLPPDWTGKVWALSQGALRAEEAKPAYYWLTDADVIHTPDMLRRLVARAEHDHLDLTSLSVLLQSRTLAERALIPAFTYFFLKLYPPRQIANPASRTAGAAGGCILLRSEMLDRIGGFAAIRGEVIDDCALARAVKRNGGRIWLGLTRKSQTLRTYGTFSEIRNMIARAAFTQLHYSALVLVVTLTAMCLTYVAPVGLLFAPAPATRLFALAAWLLMTLSFVPTLRFYRLSPLWAPLLPLVALFYSYATCLSAVRYWLGRGAQWKGRAQAPRPA